MGMEGCGKFMKWSLFGFNFLILISGCTLLGVGIYTRVNQSGLSQMSAILGNQLYSTFSILMIVCGCIVIIVSFFGCCGAIKEVRCMLGAFFILLIIIFAVLLIGGIVAYVFRGDLEKSARFHMYTSLNSTYGPEGPVTDAWNSLQQFFHCCGVEGNLNSSTSWAYYKKYTPWYDRQKGLRRYVPDSCCNSQLKMDLEKCVGVTHPLLAPSAGPPIGIAQFNNQLRADGCLTVLVGFFLNNTSIIGGVAVAIAFIMILGMVFSLCLCRAIKDEYEIG